MIFTKNKTKQKQKTNVAKSSLESFNFLNCVLNERQMGKTKDKKGKEKIKHKKLEEKKIEIQDTFYSGTKYRKKFKWNSGVEAENGNL